LAEVRIAILGAGAMGTTHAAAYAAMPEVSVAGVFSRDPARAAAVAAICKALPVTDAAQLIQRADIDAIDVCLPSENHHDVVIPALEAGKHVFCESPLALDLEQAQRMRDAARGAKRLLADRAIEALLLSLATQRSIESFTSA
jgi:UDP-N-acetylglucosamine 3-dehydrogenase